MKFSEIYNDVSPNTDEVTIISEMAYPKQDILLKLMDIDLPIIQHLIKVLKWEDFQNYDKHIGDMDRNWFNKIKYPNMKMKTPKGAKALPVKDYYQYLFTGRIETVEDIKDIMKPLRQKGYGKYPELLSDNDLYDKLKFVMEEVAQSLHDGTFNSIRDYL